MSAGWTRALAVAIAIAAPWACSAGSSTGAGGGGAGITCGAGTHLEGTSCIADPIDGGSAADSGGVPAEAGPPADAALPDGGRGVVVHDGDPCPYGRRSVCGSDNHLYSCQIANNGAHPLGTLWDSLNCDLLAGACAVDAVGNGNCKGGGYTTCTVVLNDAGNRIDTSRCFSATVVEDCNGGFWSPTDCGRAGYVCAAKTGGGASCTPP